MPFVKECRSLQKAVEAVEKLQAYDAKYHPFSKRNFTIISGVNVLDGQVFPGPIPVIEIRFVPCSEAEATHWQIHSH